MNPGILIPLAVFAFVVIVVALNDTTKIHALETESHFKLSQQEMEHKAKMGELQAELDRIRKSEIRN